MQPQAPADYTPAPPPGYPTAGPPPPGYPVATESTALNNPQDPAGEQQAHEGDGSRGLGTMLMQSGHKISHTGHQAHMLAHPVQYVKHKTVGKVRRAVHGSVDKVLGKVLPR